MVNKKILILFLFLSLSFGLFSQTPINLKSKVDTLSIKIGEEIKYEFSFVADSLNDFKFKLLKFKPPIDVIKEFQIDTLYEENMVRFIKKYSLTSFEPGSFSVIPRGMPGTILERPLLGQLRSNSHKSWRRL